ncbi:MAG TPA: hypothetical protein VER98_04870 [Terriglobia bacterium]|nr:hypothetical protein [Terriglobia bacterium]
MRDFADAIRLTGVAVNHASKRSAYIGSLAASCYVLESHHVVRRL